ncbi:MAG: transcriptional repressor [Rhodospirillales bacterium]|nr:transcriptional repressor [Rhodospirillales bacterium]
MSAETAAPAFAEHDHDHDACQDEALGRAEAICAERSVRLTDIRKRVLELVWRGHKPQGAYDILDALRKERDGAAPPTVYRALEFLLGLGLIHRIESLNAFVGCTDPETPHRAQFLICNSCGTTAELNDPRIDAAIGERAAAAGFSVNRRTIEVEGTCPHCRQADPQ